MAESNQATFEPPSTKHDAPVRPIACIDLDRFCEGCAYNLRTLPVYRDARTGIPLVRCPECGRYQSANETSTALRPWLRRATALLVGVWILVVIAGFVSLAALEGTITYATLDELTVPGGYTTQRVGSTVIRTWSTLGPLEVKTDDPDYKLFMASILLGSFGTAFLLGLFAVVICPHWRRAAYAALILGVPVAAGSLIALSWREQAPHLFDWALSYVAAHTGTQLLGGVAGIAWGRPLARLAVRVVLPPTLRPRLAYLWLADGKPPPRP